MKLKVKKQLEDKKGKKSIFRFFSPKYWPLHIGLLLLKIVALLPPILRKKLAKGLGHLMLKYASKRRHIAKTNISRCFPELSKNEQQRLLQKNFLAMGKTFIEMACCWFSDLESQKRKTTIVGQEHLDAALGKGNGVILLIFHMTSIEMGGSLLASYYDFHAMYKPNKNPLLEKAITQGRARHNKKMLDRNNPRAMIKALKNNEIVWYSTDQNYGGKTATFVPFFGIETSTITATTKLAKLTGASVVPFTQRRLDDIDEYELTIHPEFKSFASESEVVDATQINQFLESYLRKYPVDYMWLHQRFRTRPNGVNDFYENS